LDLFYRIGQFWAALTAAPTVQDLERVKQALSPPLMELFLQQQPSEQLHSLRVYDRLVSQGESSADLWVAALLHDIGKSRYPLTAIERAIVVIGQFLAPGMAAQWGMGSPRGWKRPFVTAAQHPSWGAEMAQAAGASPLTVSLIRRHQDGGALDSRSEDRGNENEMEDRLLAQLQSVDNES